MWWPLRQLLVPCNYLRIRHGDSLLESKRVYDFLLPAVLATVTVAGCVWLSVPMTFDNRPNLVGSLSQLLALMIGFYLAALAAVATFDRPGMDDPLRGGDATLKVRHHDGGHYVTKVLSRRQYVSYMFGYLSFLSMNLFIALMFFSEAWPKVSSEIAPYWHWELIIDRAINPVVFAIMVFAIWQMVITSLLAIYFLADRLQTLEDEEN